MSKAFFASRYGKGDPEDYLNCPMTKEEYDVFYQALITAESAPLKSFDKEYQEKELVVFEGCMPVEVMAKRGYDTLRFGPMKPVGLPVPSTGEDAFATVQLRRENKEGSMYNIVGFQTHLTFGEQKRVFRDTPHLFLCPVLVQPVHEEGNDIDQDQVDDQQLHLSPVYQHFRFPFR